MDNFRLGNPFLSIKIHGRSALYAAFLMKIKYKIYAGGCWNNRRANKIDSIFIILKIK